MLPQSCAASYEFVRELARGGYGTVCLARQKKLDRLVVVKVLHAASAVQEEQRLRFRDEARVTARLKHPAIVEVVDVQVEGGEAWIALEYLPGRSLADRISAAGVLPVDEAMDVAIQIAGALSAAHQAGVLHRDVKPDNVMGGEAGVWKLSDFGIAWFAGDRTLRTEAGVVLGTPAYMAPEQIQGAPGPRSDLYALGCMLFEMLAGTRPVGGNTPLEMLHAHLREERPDVLTFRPDLPRGLAALVARTIARDPGERPASCAELEAALRALRDPDRAVRGRAVRRAVPPAPSRASPPAIASRGPALALGAGIALALALAAVVSRPRPEPPKPQPTPVAIATPVPVATPSPENDDAEERKDIELRIDKLVNEWRGRRPRRGEKEFQEISAGVGVYFGLSKPDPRDVADVLTADVEAMRSMIEIDRQLEEGGKHKGMFVLLRTRTLAYRFHWSRRIRWVVRLGGGQVPDETRGCLDHLVPYADVLHSTLERCAARTGRVRQRFPLVLSSILDIKRGIDLLPFAAAEKPLLALRMRRIAEACAIERGESAADVTLLTQLALGSVATAPVPDADLARALDAVERLARPGPTESGRSSQGGKEGLAGWVMGHLGHRKRGKNR
jgi:serine/threonine protein kinase